MKYFNTDFSDQCFTETDLFRSVQQSVTTPVTTLHGLRNYVSVMTVTFCNPHQCIPEPSAPFPSPQAQSQNLTVIPDSEHPFLIMLDHSRPDRVQPDHLYLSLVSSSSLSLASSHTLPLPLPRSLCLTLLVLCLCQPYTI